MGIQPVGTGDEVKSTHAVIYQIGTHCGIGRKRTTGEIDIPEKERAVPEILDSSFCFLMNPN
jgi:hypothetical protein